MKFNYLCTMAISVIRDSKEDVSYQDFLLLCSHIAESQGIFINIKDVHTRESINSYLEEVSRSNKISIEDNTIKVNY